MSVKNFILDGLYLIRQVLFAGIILTLMLLLFNSLAAHPIFNAIGLSSISSSLFIIFTAPHTLSGQNKSILGGYAIAIAVGMGCDYLLHHPVTFLPLPLYSYYPAICSGLTLILCLSLMMLLRMPHAPAAGFALGLVLDNWEYQTIAIIFCIIAICTLIKHFLNFRPLLDSA